MNIADFFFVHIGTEASELIHGTSKDDYLAGAGGNDTIDGHEGDDTIDGGTGSDYLVGGVGNDSYIIRAGDAGTDREPDYIWEFPGEGVNSLHIGGISPSNVRIAAASHGGGLGFFRFALVDENDGVTAIDVDMSFSVTAGSDIGERIQRVTFDDGTAWDLTKGINGVGVTGQEFFIGTPQDDIYAALSGNDFIQTFAGNDTLDGGSGADFLYGGLGDDTYLIGLGDSSLEDWDRIAEEPGQGVDTLRIIGVSRP